MPTLALLPEFALAAWCAQNVFTTLTAAVFRFGPTRSEIPSQEPNVAVIVPTRGAANLADHLRLLRAQHYGAYRVIAVVESERDPAYALLRAAEGEPGAPLDVKVAGQAENAGQKVWNLLAGLDALAPDDEVVAFIDADTLPTPLWLPRLVAVLVNSGLPLATGYRWMTPVDDRWSSCCLAAADNSLAALPRGGLSLSFVWGGSVAAKRTTLEAIRIRDFWSGAISDDLQMTEALRQAGLRSQTPRQALLLTPVSASWRSLLAFGVRQYRFIWLDRPTNWAIAVACLWTPPLCLALALPRFLAGSASAWAMLAVVLALGEIRGRIRRSIQNRLWPHVGDRKDRRRWRAERWLRPLWWLAHALCAAGAPLSRTIDWAGIRYRVNARQSVVIERRESAW